jgi:hypothetical protein
MRRKIKLNDMKFNDDNFGVYPRQKKKRNSFKKAIGIDK